MKRLQLFSIILCVIAVAIFGVYRYQSGKNVDKLGPQIKMEENKIEVSVNATDEDLLAGVTAQDPKDGDVTDSLVIENISNFMEQGQRLISYVAFDSDNHVTKATRELRYTDYTSPRFALEEPLSFDSGVTSITDYLSASDCMDGNISEKIKISADSTVYTDVSGEYQVKFQVSNSGGDVVYLPATVEIYDSSESMTRPQIGLTDYIVYTPIKKKLNLKSYLEKVTIGGQEYALVDSGETYGTENDSGYHTINRSRITITGDKKYKKPGTYEVLYSMTSTDGTRGNVRLIVVAEDIVEQEESDESGN